MCPFPHTCTAGVKPSPPTAAEFFLISAVAKLGATVLTYPLLVVKSRLQAANKDTHVDLKYTGAVDAVTRIWKHEGEDLLQHCKELAPVSPTCDLQSTADAVRGCSAAQPLQTMQLRIEGQQAPGQDAWPAPLAWELLRAGWQHHIQGGCS